MRLAGIILFAMIMAQSAQPAKKVHIWETAKVVALMPTQNYLEQLDRRGESSTITIRDTLVFLEGEAFSYIVVDTKRSGSVPLHHGLIGDIGSARDMAHHSCRLIVNDSVRFYQDKRILHVLDADGQECKMDIFVQTRLPEPR